MCILVVRVNKLMGGITVATFNLRNEFDMAQRQIVFGDMSLLERSLGISSDREARQLASVRIAELSQNRPDKRITEFDIKQAIADFSDSSQAFHRDGNTKLGAKCGRAMSVLVEAYIAATGDVDVYRALPTGRLLNDDLKSERPGAQRLHPPSRFVR